MTEEQVELSRRAVACTGWKWMPGMADQFGRRVMQVYPDELGLRWSHLLENTVVRDADALPDLTDHATLGCMVGLVRELYHAPWKLWDGHIEVRRDHQTLFFAMQFRHTPESFLEEVHVGSGSTEVEAWVAALEASHEATQS